MTYHLHIYDLRYPDKPPYKEDFEEEDLTGVMYILENSTTINKLAKVFDAEGKLISTINGTCKPPDKDIYAKVLIAMGLTEFAKKA